MRWRPPQHWQSRRCASSWYSPPSSIQAWPMAWTGIELWPMTYGLDGYWTVAYDLWPGRVLNHGTITRWHPCGSVPSTCTDNHLNDEATGTSTKIEYEWHALWDVKIWYKEKRGMIGLHTTYLYFHSSAPLTLCNILTWIKHTLSFCTLLWSLYFIDTRWTQTILSFFSDIKWWYKKEIEPVFRSFCRSGRANVHTRSLHSNTCAVPFCITVSETKFYSYTTINCCNRVFLMHIVYA